MQDLFLSSIFQLIVCFEDILLSVRRQIKRQQLEATLHPSTTVVELSIFRLRGKCWL